MRGQALCQDKDASNCSFLTRGTDFFQKGVDVSKLHLFPGLCFLRIFDCQQRDRKDASTIIAGVKQKRTFWISSDFSLGGQQSKSLISTLCWADLNYLVFSQVSNGLLVAFHRFFRVSLCGNRSEVPCLSRQLSSGICCKLIFFLPNRDISIIKVGC